MDGLDAARLHHGPGALGLIGTDAFQEIDATGITMPIVKHSWLVQDVEELPRALKAAFHVAQTGRKGPVLVDIAKDVQEAEFDFVYPDHVDLPGWKPPHKVHPRQLREAARAIAVAQRPIVYAGGGVLNADACDELLELVDSAQLPAVVTLMGKGCLPDSHPLELRRARHARLQVRELGAEQGRSRDRDRGALRRPRHGQGLGVRAGRKGDPLRHRRRRGREDPARGDPGRRAAQARAVAAGAEVETRPQTAPPDRSPWLRQLEEWREQFPFRYEKARRRLKPQTVIEALRDLAATRDEDVVWTTGVGQHQMWAMQYIQCDKPRSFITSGGLGTMGYGIPAAIGAKAARPDATVVCIDGDGCFQMTCQELATAALERLPIVAVIINNGWLGMVRQWQEMFYDERFAQTHLTHAVPNYAQLAEAYGCAGFTVETEDELEAALTAAFSAGRSAVVDVRCAAEEKCFPMIPAGAAAVDVVEAPGARSSPHDHHTISVRLENKPGALARVSQLFSRRGYNIQSLAVGPTERPDISRLTLRVDCSEHSLEQIEKQMHKLVNVLRVTELRPDEAIERELALITVAVVAEKRAELVALAR